MTNVSPSHEQCNDLVKAIGQGRLHEVALALQRNPAAASWEWDGWPMLGWAVWRDRFDAAELLLKAGADINMWFDGVTPFIVRMAAQDGPLKKIYWLIERGANPNVKSKDGETALIKAILRVNHALCEKLVLADASLKDEIMHEGRLRTAHELALDMGDKQLYAKLFMWRRAYEKKACGVIRRAPAALAGEDCMTVMPATFPACPDSDKTSDPTAFFKAIRKGDLSEIREILERHPGAVHWTQAGGYSPAFGKGIREK